MNFRSAPEYYPKAAGDRTTTPASRTKVALSLEHCPNRSPNAEPLKKHSAQKEHTVAWDLISAQSAHRTILQGDLSAEAETLPFQFIVMNMPQVIEEFPQLSAHQPFSSSPLYLKESSEEKSFPRKENCSKKTACREATGLLSPVPGRSDSARWTFSRKRTPGLPSLISRFKSTFQEAEHFRGSVLPPSRLIHRQ